MRALTKTLFCFFLVSLPSFVYAWDASVHGYYRTRFEFSQDLDLQRPSDGVVPGDADNNTNDRFGTLFYAQQRLRLNPNVKINDNIALHGQIDLLDNLLFGQSDVNSLVIYNPVEGSIQMSAANGPFGVIGPAGGDPLGGGGGNFNVRRAWVDILTSAGQFRIGRQPSQFGLGIYSNDGDAMEGDFGDTYDRVMYLAGIRLKSGGRFNFGLVYDYAYSSSFDPSFNGVSQDVDSSWNDTMQTGALIMYVSDNFELGLFGGIRFRDGMEGETTTTAMYVDNCAAGDGRPDDYTCAAGDVADENYDLDNDGQINDLIELPAGKDGNTFVYTGDLYGKWKIGKHYTFAFEGVYVGGKIAPGIAVDAIALDAESQNTITNPLTAPIELPQDGTQNDIQVIMGAAEFDAIYDYGGEVHIQAGYASGDGDPLSSLITQLGFRPDYDIALILFDQPIGTSPALVIGGVTELGRMPMSPNYINNAIYGTLEYKQKFDISRAIPWAEDFKIGIKGITAYAPANNLDLDLSAIASAATGQEVTSLPHIVNSSRWYGFEVDASVEATFFENLKWRLVGGFFYPGPLYDTKDDNNSQPGIVDAILFDKADIAFAAKTTLYFEF